MTILQVTLRTILLIYVHVDNESRRIAARYLSQSEKWIKTTEQLGFLLSLRRKGMLPPAILNNYRLPICLSHRKESVARLKRFQSGLLNDMIQEHFSKRDFHSKEVLQLKSILFNHKDKDFVKFIFKQQELIVNDTQSRNRNRLRGKLVWIQKKYYTFENVNSEKAKTRTNTPQVSKTCTILENPNKKIVISTNDNIDHNALNCIDKGAKFALTRHLDRKTEMDMRTNFFHTINKLRWQEYYANVAQYGPPIKNVQTTISKVIKESPFNRLVSQAPKGSPTLETDIKLLTMEFESTLSKFKRYKTKSNYKSSEYRALKQLVSSPSYTIKMTDKSKVFSIMDTNEMKAKIIEEHLTLKLPRVVKTATSILFCKLHWKYLLTMIRVH